MSDLANSAGDADAVQAGALLRAARQQQGLHIAALAASIKVAPAKLEALESGRVHELPDATFTRALALAVCRVLKIDAAPVLALLPGAVAGRLERVDSGLNTPFRERAGRGDSAAWLPWRHPVLWLVAGLLTAAAAFVLVPGQSGTLAMPELAANPVMPPSGGPGALPIAEAAPLPAAASSAAAGLATAVPASAAGASAAASLIAPLTTASTTASNTALATPAATSPGATAASALPAPAASPAPSSESVLVLRAVQATWVQAVDGGGQTLMARLVPAGETLALNPALPVRLRIGNAQGTELLFKGRPVDLSAAARENIATITLP